VYISRMWGEETPERIAPKFCLVIGRDPVHNHVYQIWWRSVKGFLFGGGPKFVVSHCLCWSSL